MKHFISVIFKNQLTESKRDIVLDTITNTAKVGLLNSKSNYQIFESENNTSVLRIPLKTSVPEKLQKKFVETIANRLFDKGHTNFEIELSVINEATLRRGSSGPEVQALQQQLGIPADGIFGPATEQAVKTFQQRSGIQVDGIVGGQTQSAIAAGGTPRNAGAPRPATASAPAPTAAPTSSPRPQPNPNNMNQFAPAPTPAPTAGGGVNMVRPEGPAAGMPRATPGGAAPKRTGPTTDGYRQSPMPNLQRQKTWQDSEFRAGGARPEGPAAGMPAATNQNVPPRPEMVNRGSPIQIQQWDRRYGATHNPDGTPKNESISPRPKGAFMFKERADWDKMYSATHHKDGSLKTRRSFFESKELEEETYHGNDFFEAYEDLWFNEDEMLDEAEYQGRKVPLGKPMRGDVKKFKVYVKKPGGNVVKVNFGDPDMKIKKSNPARRRSFRARHNCDNPGPRTKARYWSCRKW